MAILGSGPVAEGHAAAMLAQGPAVELLGVAEDGEPLLREADAAVVATAPDRRAADALRALELGCDILVEPPGAEGLRAVQALAARTGRQPIVAVGHETVYDPTLRAARHLVGDGQIIAVEAVRLEPFDDHPGHPDVVDDLLLGPLQVAMAIAGRPPAVTQAAGRQVRRGQGLDHVTSTLCFDDDLIAVLTAGRAGMRRAHRVVVETPLARVTADLLAGVVEAERDLPGRGVVVERPPVKATCARTAQAAAFVRSCRDRRPASVGIGVGLALLEAAELVRKRVAPVAHRPGRGTLRAA